MKKVCTYICLLTVLWLLAAGTVLEQQRLAARVIRLHILANSDSAEDQTEKLRVRDALLGEIEALTADCTSREEAAAKLAGAAEEIGERAAAMTGRPVTVSLSPERYGTRHYGSFSLPAGTYLSLRIGLGEAAGHNWWCVAFPAVCTAATAEELETTAVAAGLSGGEVRLMTEDSPDIRVRFFLLELLSSLREKLRG